MTQEDKELLIKDLCARLPYRVKGVYNADGDKEEIEVSLATIRILQAIPANEDFPITLKPYLRPMSSMTEEEKEEYKRLCREETFTFATWAKVIWYDTWESIDWLNAHHFDYRGLIGKGLALQAPEGIY